jgi:hypothetical protein
MTSFGFIGSFLSYFKPDTTKRANPVEKDLKVLIDASTTFLAFSLALGFYAVNILVLTYNFRFIIICICFWPSRISWRRSGFESLEYPLRHFLTAPLFPVPSISSVAVSLCPYFIVKFEF